MTIHPDAFHTSQKPLRVDKVLGVPLLREACRRAERPKLACEKQPLGFEIVQSHIGGTALMGTFGKLLENVSSKLIADIMTTKLEGLSLGVTEGLRTELQEMRVGADAVRFKDWQIARMRVDGMRKTWCKTDDHQLHRGHHFLGE